MTTRWLLGMLLAMALGVQGCGDDSGGSPAAEGPTDGGVGEEDDSGLQEQDSGRQEPDSGRQEPDAGGQEELRCAVQGATQTEQGTPLEGLRIVLCDDRVCYTDETDATGTFVFPDVPRVPLTLKVLGAPAGYSSLTLPPRTCEGPELEIPAVRLLSLPAGTVIAAADGGTVQAHEDLALTLPPGVLFPNFDSEPELRALRVPPALVPDAIAALAPGAETFAIDPFGATSAEPIGFEARLDLPPGRISVRTLDHLTGEVHEALQVEVAADGSCSSPAGEGVGELSWLLFVPVAQ